MSRKKPTRIFLREERLRDFMWVVEGSDGSIYMCFSDKRLQESIQAFFTKEGKFSVDNSWHQILDTRNPKISFHPSGEYKLSTSIKSAPSSSCGDRVTATGPKLEEIDEPRLMVEIFLPDLKFLAIRKERPSNSVVFNIEEFPSGPLRCSVSCASLEWYNKESRDEIRWFDTSTCEASEYIEMPLTKTIWIWTLRQSRNDMHIPPSGYRFFLFGNPRHRVTS